MSEHRVLSKTLRALRAIPCALVLLLPAACGDDTEVQLVPDASSLRDATVEGDGEAGGGHDASDAGDATADTSLPEDAPSEAADAPGEDAADAADASTDVEVDGAAPEAGEEDGATGDDGGDAATE
jgi:hypothetical protein